MDVVKLTYDNLLHVYDIGTEFQNGRFNEKMDTDCM